MILGWDDTEGPDQNTTTPTHCFHRKILHNDAADNFSQQKLVMEREEKSVRGKGDKCQSRRGWERPREGKDKSDKPPCLSKDLSLPRFHTPTKHPEEWSECCNSGCPACSQGTPRTGDQRCWRRKRKGGHPPHPVELAMVGQCSPMTHPEERMDYCCLEMLASLTVHLLGLPCCHSALVPRHCER